MRARFAISLLALLWPVATLAQAPSSPAANSAAPSPPSAATSPSSETTPSTAAGQPARRGGGDITRDQYVERAKQAAERRFDQMDADHDGVLTADERRAYRESHHRNRAAPATH